MRYLSVALLLAGLSLCLIACTKAQKNLSTPRDSLNTVRSALRNKDLELLKQILSADTLASLESERTKTNESVDDLLRGYVERSQQSEGAAEAVEEEQRLDETRVELRGKNGRPLGRFIREGDEWKLDGFGWRRER